MPPHAMDQIGNTCHKWQFEPNPWLSYMPALVQGVFRCDKDGDPAAHACASAIFQKSIPQDCWMVACDETLFKPLDNYGPADNGIMHSHYDENGPNVVFTVIDVAERESGAIYHLGTFEPDHVPFLVGQSIIQQIDPARRLYYSRAHVCGHLIGLIIHRLLDNGILEGLKRELGVRRSPKLCVDFDGVLKGCTKRAIATINRELDSMIKKDTRLENCNWTAEEVEREGFRFPGRKPGSRELVRVIKVHGEGCYECFGTFVAKTGTVGPAAVVQILIGKEDKKITSFMYGITPSVP